MRRPTLGDPVCNKCNEHVSEVAEVVGGYVCDSNSGPDHCLELLPTCTYCHEPYLGEVEGFCCEECRAEQSTHTRSLSAANKGGHNGGAMVAGKPGSKVVQGRG